VNPALIPVIGQLVAWFTRPRQAPPSPDGDPESPKETLARKVREPSTALGLAELAGVLALFMGPEWADAIALLLLGFIGVVNVWRAERAPKPPAR
jgi:hypothetical protein